MVENTKMEDNIPCKQLKKKKGVPIVPQWLTNPTGIHEDMGSIPGLNPVG